MAAVGAAVAAAGGGTSGTAGGGFHNVLAITDVRTRSSTYFRYCCRILTLSSPTTHKHTNSPHIRMSRVLLRRGGVVCEAEVLDGLIKGGPSPHPAPPLLPLPSIPLPSCLQGVRK